MATSGDNVRDRGEPSGSDRRKFPRVPAHVQVFFHLGDEMEPLETALREVSGRAMDASLGGVSMLTPQPMLPGTKLNLEFQVSGPHPEPFTVKARGLVRWSRLGAPPVLMGVEFTRLDPPSRETLSQWLEMLTD